MLCRFQRQGRMLQLYGNHNMELKEKTKNGTKTAENYRKRRGIEEEPGRTKTAENYQSRRRNCENFWKEGLKEGALLENRSGGRDICLIHGHQADFFNSVLWKLSRFLVRYLWKPLEHFGVNDPTSAAKNFKKQSRYERCMAEWAKEKDIYLAAGHSHRPALPGEGGLYINTGSCVHPGGITAVEIENMKMTLVKWQMSTRPDMTLFVERVTIAGPVEVE